MNALIFVTSIYTFFWVVMSSRMIIGGAENVLIFFHGHGLYPLATEVYLGPLSILFFHIGMFLGVRHLRRVWYFNYSRNKKLIILCILLGAPYVLWSAGYLRGTSSLIR